MRILCVDDDPAILLLLERVLRSAGHETMGAATGAAALQQIVQHSFDLVITDMMLPDLRGADIIRATKVQAPALPAIGISANQDPAVKAEFIDAGVGRFLPKPFRIADLLSEVRLVDSLQGRLRLLLAGPVAEEKGFIRALRQEGFVVLSAPGREETLGLLREQSIDVLVCEDGADPGAGELLAWRRAKLEREHVVVIVATHAESNDHELLTAGASLCLGRPLDASPLASMLHFMVTPRKLG